MTDVGIAAGIIILVGAILYIGNASMTSRHNAGSSTHAHFVGVAETVPQEATEKVVVGTLLVNADGITFAASPKWNHVRGVSSPPPADERHYKWTEISATQLRRHPTKPLPGFVDIALSNGSTVTFRVNLFGKLSKALAQSAHSAPDSPGAG